MMTRTLATVVSVDESRRPTILLDGSSAGAEVAALRAGGYNPQPGDRCVVTKIGLRFIAEYAVDGPLSAGLSAYEVAVANGFNGTEAEWLQSLVGPAGKDGQNGASAYQVAVANGFSGTEAEWLASLKGEDGAGVEVGGSAFVPIVCDFMNANYYGNAPLVGSVVQLGSCEIAPTPEAKHPGVVRILGGSNANGGYRFSTDLAALRIAGGETFEVIFKVQQAQGLIARFGFHQTTTHGAGTWGAWLDVTPQDSTHVLIRGQTRSDTDALITGTSYTLDLQVWYRARLEISADAMRVDFTLYDEAGSILWSDELETTAVIAQGYAVGANVIATNANGGSVQIYLDRVAFSIDRALVR